MRALVFAIALAGCAAVGESGEEQLAREIAGRVAGEPRDCVPASTGHTLHAIDNQTIVYRTSDTVWVNRLGGECSGLGPLSTLQVEAFSSQFCRGDRVRGVEPGQSIPGPYCPLGQFVPYRTP